MLLKETFLITTLYVSCFCFIPEFAYFDPTQVGGNSKHYCAPEYYCGYAGDQVNIMCSKDRCAPKPNCGEYFQMWPLTQQERFVVQHVHNEIRHDLSIVHVDHKQLEKWKDKTKSNPQLLYYYPRIVRFPGKFVNKRIKYMNLISYDKELEFLSQCMVNNCLHSGREKVAEGECRRTSQYRDPGYTKFLYTVVSNKINSFNFSEEKYLDAAFFSWYNEVLSLTTKEFEDILENYTYKGGKKVQNFIQMTYPAVKYVGCAKSQFGFGNSKTLAIICSYDVRPKENKAPFPLGVGCATSCPGLYDHPNMTITQQRLYCTNGSGVIYAPGKFHNCMYMFHAVVRRRVYKYEKFYDQSTDFPCLCGRPRTLRKDVWIPPFEISSKMERLSVRNCGFRFNYFFILLLFLIKTTD